MALEFTRYQQHYFLQERNIPKGICVGLAMREVTEKGIEEEKGIALQNEYSRRTENMYLDSFIETEGAQPDPNVNSKNLPKK